VEPSAVNARTAPGPGATWYRLGDGTEVHVYGPPDEFHDFFGDGPVVGFAVDSSARRTRT
jgi:hypothetical protein